MHTDLLSLTDYAYKTDRKSRRMEMGGLSGAANKKSNQKKKKTLVSFHLVKSNAKGR